MEYLVYLETFSTVCRPETYRIMFIIAISNKWKIQQYDVKNAFVHADIDEEIYTILPTGFYTEDKYKNKVCRLRKALYGLKQAPRLWYKHLEKILYKLGYTVFNHDDGAFINPNTQSIILCHVDDIIITGPNPEEISAQINKAKEEIKIQSLGEISTFLGINIRIDYKNNKLHMDQNNYTRNILEKYNKTNLYPRNNPLPTEKLRANNNKASKEEINLYQKYIGSLLYLALKTRPDIAFPVQYCARYCSNPGILHFQAVDHIFAYLNKYPEMGITYTGINNKNLLIKAYSDSDWGNCTDSRRSTTGYITTLGDNIISWCVTLQKSVALSSTEAEYMAITDCSKETIYLQNTITDLNKALKLEIPINIPVIMEDNTGAIKLSHNAEFHKRTKHIDIKYHFIRELVENNKIRIIYINTKNQLADPLTKLITGPRLAAWKDKIGLEIF